MKKKFICLLLVLALMLSIVPASVFADFVAPFQTSIGEVIRFTEDAYSGYTFVNTTYVSTTTDLYTVKLPYGTQEVELSFAENRIAYGYKEDGTYVDNCATGTDLSHEYSNNGQDGQTSAIVRLNGDKFPDYVQVQTPYVVIPATPSDLWASELLYAVNFEYTYTFSAVINGQLATESDLTFTKNAYTYTPYLGTPTDYPVVTISVPQGTGSIDLNFSDNVLVYNYSAQGEYLAGWVADATQGTKSITVNLDANNDGLFDYIQIQKPYSADWSSGGDMLYAITFDDGVSHSGGSIVSGPVTVDSLLANISSQYVDLTTDWNVIDLAAYAQARSNALSKLSNTAKKTFINKAITDLQGNLNDTSIDKYILGLTGLGVDVTNLYPVNSNTTFSAINKLNGVSHSTSAWSAPYTLVAYGQGNYGADSYINSLISSVLVNQSPDGSWNEYGTIDTTGNMIAALSMYKNIEGVQTAIDNAVTYLSSQQQSNGAYDDGQVGGWAAGINSNSTAMVIIGLAANGINPATDVRFIKSGHSLIDGLLSFALSDSTGFGYINNTSKNVGSTEQCFRALVAASKVMSTGNAYNVYDFSDVAVSPARATGTESQQAPDDSTGDNITVYLTIKSDVDYWMRRKAVTLPGTGAKVYHALVQGLIGSGITQSGAANGYIESITKSGKTLGEFTQGANSGWLYKVNGQLPTVDLVSQSISNGDEILWYFTDDWTEDVDASSYISTTVTEKKETPAAVLDAVPFVDIAKTDWFYTYITSAYALKMVDGVDATHFDPTSNLSRAMLVTMLWKLEGKPSVTASCVFEDVAKDAWYENPIIWAYEHKIINGMDATHFEANTDITREQTATILYNYAKYKKYSVTKKNDLSIYKDNTKISSWALDALKWANAMKIMIGDESGLRPGSTATRAEAATLMVNFVEKAK